MIHPAVTCTKCNFRAPLYDDNNSTVNDLAEHLKVCPGNPYIRALASSRELIADLRKQLHAERRKHMPPDQSDEATPPGEFKIGASIGRIVVYNHPGSADGTYPPTQSPAIIQKAHADGSADLWVFGPKGLHKDGPLKQGAGPCQWDFAPRV